jgi:hypothetical protein
MVRVSWKGLYFNKYILIKLFNKNNTNLQKRTFIFDKSLIILKAFNKNNIIIYKGNLYRRLNKFFIIYFIT